MSLIDALRNSGSGLIEALKAPNVINLEKPVETQQLDQTFNQVDTVKLREAIGKAETRGVKNPYSFKQPSGSSTLGDALGKYQVTVGELKTYATQYLGKQITPEKFLASQQLQDRYMDGKIAALQAKGITPERIAEIHRGGMNSKPGSRADYSASVINFMK